MNFAKKISTKICYEKPCKDNPFVAEESYLYGYDVLGLIENYSYIEVVYLLFCGELPSEEKLQLFNALAVGLINPGPRHPASRAAMTAAISKSAPENILPIGVLALSGEHVGAIDVYRSAKFLESKVDCSPGEVAKLLHDCLLESEDKEGRVPGFGVRFGSVDPLAGRLASFLADLPAAGRFLSWGRDFVSFFDSNSMGWLMTGVAAAALLDLGFSRRSTSGVFQLLSAPGVLAYGVEQSFKNVTEMPFVEDECYEYKRK